MFLGKQSPVLSFPSFRGGARDAASVDVGAHEDGISGSFGGGESWRFRDRFESKFVINLASICGSPEAPRYGLPQISNRDPRGTRAATSFALSSGKWTSSPPSITKPDISPSLA